MTLRLDDLLSVEKYSALPMPLTVVEAGNGQYNYEIGNISYWPPAPSLGIFYSNAGQITIGKPGIFIIRKN
jgi:hypothetical protein